MSSSQLNFIFFRGIETTNQIMLCKGESSSKDQKFQVGDVFSDNSARLVDKWDFIGYFSGV